MSAKIVTSAKSVFTEAWAAGQAGTLFDEAWMASAARDRLSRPAADPAAARERRDKVLYFFEEGLRAGWHGGSVETAWLQSYSLVIARDLAERAALRKIEARAPMAAAA